MENLKIHSESGKNHLKVLEDKYNTLKQSLKHNPTLTEEEKKQELKKLNKQLKTERRNANRNLY